jgi:hypothetical protein
MASKQNTAKWDTAMENIVRSTIDALKQHYAKKDFRQRFFWP